jgi:ABC-type sugar transport system permease subunit
VRLSSFWRAESARNVLFCLPAAILLGLVVVYPILRTTILSLFHLKLATQFRPEFAGPENFVRLLFDSRFHDSLKVTGVFTAVSVALEFGIGLLLALAANALIRGKSLVRTILLVPWTLPTAIIAVLWTWIFNDQYGVLNTLLMKTGITKEAIPWLAGPHTAMAAIVMADVWKTVPFVFLVLLAGLQNVPRELHEAVEMAAFVTVRLHLRHIPHYSGLRCLRSGLRHDRRRSRWRNGDSFTLLLPDVYALSRLRIRFHAGVGDSPYSCADSIRALHVFASTI